MDSAQKAMTCLNLRPYPAEPLLARLRPVSLAAAMRSATMQDAIETEQVRAA
jgi:hypothetical protein